MNGLKRPKNGNGAGGAGGAGGIVELDTRQREILRLLWRGGRMSRWELHRQTGVNPNAVGVDVAALLNHGIVRECPSEIVGPGRPRIPLEIDPTIRYVVGLSISPGRVQVSRLTLRGQLLGRTIQRPTTDPTKAIATAQSLLEESMSDKTLAIGLTVTGFVDPEKRSILLSSSFAGHGGGISLEPLYEMAGGRPVVLENNMHALAAWWLLIHQAESDEDV